MENCEISKMFPKILMCFISFFIVFLGSRVASYFVLITGALWRIVLHLVRTCEKHTGGFTGVRHSVKDAKCWEKIYHSGEMEREMERGKRGTKEG